MDQTILEQYLASALLGDIQDASVVLDAMPSIAVLFKGDALSQALTGFRQTLDDLFPDNDDVQQRFIPALATLLEQSATSTPDNNTLNSYDDATRRDLLTFLPLLLRQMYRHDSYTYPTFTRLLDWGMRHYQHPLSRDELKRMVELRALKEACDIKYKYSDDVLLAMVRFGQEAEAIKQAHARLNINERYHALFQIYEQLHAFGKDTTRCIDLLIETVPQINTQMPLWKMLVVDISEFDLDDALRVLPFIEDVAIRDDTLFELIVRRANDGRVSKERLLELLGMIDNWGIHTRALMPIVIKVVQYDHEEAKRIMYMRRMMIEPINYFLQFRIGYHKYPDHRKYEPVSEMYEFAKQIQDPLARSVALAETATLVYELPKYGWDGQMGQWIADIEYEIPDHEITTLTMSPGALWEIENAGKNNIDDAELYYIEDLLGYIDLIRNMRQSLRLVIHHLRPLVPYGVIQLSKSLSKIKSVGIRGQAPLALVEHIADEYPEIALALTDDTHLRIDTAKALAVIASHYAAKGEHQKAQQYFDEALQIARDTIGETKSARLAYIARHLITFDRTEAGELLKEARLLESMTPLSKILKESVLRTLARSQVNTDPDFAHALIDVLDSPAAKIEVCQTIAEQHIDKRAQMKDEIIGYIRVIPSYEFNNAVKASLGIAKLYDKKIAEDIFQQTLKSARAIKKPQTAARSLLTLALFTDDEDTRNQLFIEAENKARGQRDHYDQDSLLGHIAFERSKVDLEKGLASARAIQEPRFRAESLVRIASHQTENGEYPRELWQEARDLIDTLTDTSVQGSLLTQLISQQLKAGDDVQDLLEAITDENPRTFAYIELVKHHLAHDVPQALAYLDKITVERYLHSALQFVIPQLIVTDPDIVDRLIARIQDPENKNVAQRIVVRAYCDQGLLYKALMELPTHSPESLVGFFRQNLPDALSAQYDDPEHLFLELIFIVLDTFSHVQPDWQDVCDIVASQLPKHGER